MLEFDSAGLEAAEATFRSVRMEPAQHALLKDLADLIGPRIGMDRIPCFGFWLQAVRAWQVEHQTAADALQTMTPPERAAAARQIRAHFARIAGSQLRDPAQREELDSILDEGFAFYMERYNRR